MFKGILSILRHQFVLVIREHHGQGARLLLTRPVMTRTLTALTALTAQSPEKSVSIKFASIKFALIKSIIRFMLRIREISGTIMARHTIIRSIRDPLPNLPKIAFSQAS